MGLDADELNDADWDVIGELRNGRATPQYIADQTGLSRPYASDRLKRFREHGMVDLLARGLYELRPEEIPDDD